MFGNRDDVDRIYKDYISHFYKSIDHDYNIRISIISSMLIMKLIEISRYLYIGISNDRSTPYFFI